MTVTDVATFAVLGFFGARLVGGLRASRSGNGRLLITEIVRGIRWRHVWPVPLLLAVVSGAAAALMAVPGLSWGWWTAIGGDGNPVFGSSDATVGTVWEWLVPLLFMAMLFPALPLFAHAEERIFRAGAEDWSPSRRAYKVLQFGLVHAIVGIPVGAALALSLGGAHFMGVYLRDMRRHGSRRDATIESARAHTVYNGVIVVLVAVVVVLDAVL